MRFTSDRGGRPAVSARSAIRAGLAPDGGLYVPESLPKLARGGNDWAPGTLFEAGVALLGPYFDDLDEDALRALLVETWDFDAPVVSLEPGLALLELFHGPTLAFKDFGARFLAGYLATGGEPLTILVATSGDTGGAVAAGFLGAPGITVYLLYPAGRVTPIQEAQMATLGGNIRAIEVSGTFDDCQRLVKGALGDARLAADLRLTTANSINLGRLLPQMAYYGAAFGPVLGTLPGFDSIASSCTLVVPSGNFGNVTAALYARTMGVPIGPIVAAVNANDVVPRILGGEAADRSVSIHTLSSAMDVAAPSNLSRLLHLAGGSVERLGTLMTAETIDDVTTGAEIRHVYETTGRIIDPHTAVGLAVARRRRAAGDPAVLVASTAHPAKFPEVIEPLIGRVAPLPARLAEALDRPKYARSLPPDDEAFRHLLRTDT
ncbi:MAG TPA: threonine synthase [Candidatus Eisenbacteria bacterium]